MNDHIIDKCNMCGRKDKRMWYLQYPCKNKKWEQFKGKEEDRVQYLYNLFKQHKGIIWCLCNSCFKGKTPKREIL